MLYMEKQPIWTVFCAKIPQPAIVSASAGVPPAALVAAAQAAGSTGGRLWRQSLHLSALLSSVSWRDDKCNHQENNIILYLPRLYQVPYLPCAVQQDSGIFRSGMEFLIWESKFIFLKKKLVKWQQWHLWQFAHMLPNILNLQIYWRYFAVF